MDLDHNATGDVHAALSDSMRPFSGGTVTNDPSAFPLSLSDGSVALPVEMTAFTAAIQDGSASYSEARTVALGAPDALALRAPFPTPARGAVTLRYALPTATNVLIDLFGVMGRHVATLRDGTEPSGRNEAQFTMSRLSLLAPRYSPSPPLLHAPTPPPSPSRHQQFRRPPPSRR